MMNNLYKIGAVENESHFRNFLEDKLHKFSNVILWKTAEECYHDERVGELDLLLLDIALPHMGGIDLLKHLKSKYPDLKILVLSGISSDEIIFEALKFGASGYLWKNEAKELKESIEEVLEGKASMSPSIGVRILHYFRSKVANDLDNTLSTREKQVLELIISGVKVAAIAERLGITVSTTRKHIANMYSKLQVTDRVELIKKAGEMGYM